MNQPKQFQRQRQQIIGPKTILIYRNSEHGFGFTLRHFIVYPPDSQGIPAISDQLLGLLNATQPMDTVFVKEVRPNGPAHVAGLNAGDRLLSVNGLPVAGTPYNCVVKTIQQASTTLKLIVVPRECDILQTLFSESAHNPETNQRPRTNLNHSDYGTNAANCTVPMIATEPLPSTTTAPAPSYPMHQPQSITANPPKLNSEKMQTYLNDAVNRHSFSESIYSEPYYMGSRYDGIGQRIDPRLQQQRNGTSMPYHNVNGTGAGPLHQSTIEISGRIVPLSKSNSASCQSYASMQMPPATSKSIHSRRSDSAAVLVKSSHSYDASSLRPHERSDFLRSTNSCEVSAAPAVIASATSRPKKHYDDDMRMPNDVSRNSKADRKYSEPCVSASVKVEPRGVRANSEQFEQRLLPPKADNVFQYEFPTPTATEPNNDDLATNTASEATANGNEKTTTTAAVVLRRQKHVGSNFDRPVRRISYLRATANDTSVQEITAAEAAAAPMEPCADISENGEPIEDDLRIFLKYLKRETPADKSKSVSLTGKLHIKVAYIDGKRNPIRPWHLILAEIRGNQLEISVLASASEATKSPAASETGVINLQLFHVTKSNYTKRKNVFKLTTCVSKPKQSSPQMPTSLPINSKTEFLIQTDDAISFERWKNALQTASGNTLAVDASKETQSTSSTQEEGSGSGGGNSSTSQTTTNASEIGGLSKSRTWKDLVARQFRRIQGQPNSPTTPPTNASFQQQQQQKQSVPEAGASIGVPLAQCPVSEKNKLIPLIMERCTEIVETRGLHIIGIYRIPGNTAAITALTEQVNRGFDEQTLADPKWDDVNVVSSLLKSFLRRLPEALLPNDMYAHFIEADTESGQKRLVALKTLIENLPSQSYATLKHLMCHLNLVSRNCDTNLMEPKNLAIIFGPSVVRTSNETLETVVKDMKHQCRIVEALVSNYDYFFENGSLPLVYEHTEQALATTPRSQTNLLLDNVSKIEPYKDQIDKSRFVFKLVQAARSRKTKNKSNRKSTISSMTSDTMSIDSSSTSTEYKDIVAPKSEDLVDNDGGLRSSLSADDSSDLFFEDSSSMSLANLIPALEDKFHMLRNSTTYDYDLTQTPNNSTDTSIGTIISPTTMRNMKLDSLQPLTLGDENIPYADESPDQPMIPALNFKSIRQQNIPTAVRYKSWSTTPSIDVDNSTTENHSITSKGLVSAIATTANVTASIANPNANTAVVDDAKSIASMSSDDTDESNTSDLIENQTIRISREVIREMNRILTTLERKATKLNRSLSLNIKYHNSECCCNNVTVNNGGSTHSSCRSIATNRYSLTKDEKTDKNINKKRQIQDINKNNKRYTNRPIKRRHTVGGIPTLIKVNENQYCNKAATAATAATTATTTPTRRA